MSIDRPGTRNRSVALLAVLLASAGCPAAPGVRDTSEPVQPCDEGWVRDGDGACVPEACGVGRWGGLEGATVFVDLAAAEGGDGSQDAPFSSIQAGIDLAGAAGGAVVAVAAGSYPQALVWGPEHDGVRLMGRCQELVTLDASVDSELLAGVDLDLGAGSASMAGLTLSGSPYIGLLVRSGGLQLSASTVRGAAYGGLVVIADSGLPAEVLVEDSTLSDNVGVGAHVQYDATLTLVRSVVQDTVPYGGLNGIGIQAYWDATLVLEDSLVSGSTGVGLIAGDSRTTVSLLDSVIRQTSSDVTGEGGFGIALTGGVTLHASGCSISESTQVALHAHGEGTTATLSGCELRDTRQGDNPDATRGAQVTAGARVTLLDSALLDNEGPGVLIKDGGAVEIERCEIARNLQGGLMVGAGGQATVRASTLAFGIEDDQGLGGAGAYVYEGGQLDLQDSLVEGNRGVGLFVTNGGSHASLARTVIRDTLPDAAGLFGYGLLVTDEATVSMQSCDLDHNTQAGMVVGMPRTEVSMRETTIQRTLPMDSGEGGVGLSVAAGAGVEAEGCTLSGNAAVALLINDEGSAVRMARTTIEDTAPDALGDLGYGVQVAGGAQLVLEDSDLIDNTKIGVLVLEEGSSARLSGGSVMGTRRHGAQTVGAGVAVQEGAVVEAEGLLLSGQDGPALLVIDSDTRVSCVGCEIEGNRFAGAVVVEGAALELDGCEVSGTLPQENLGGGVGVHAERWDDEPPALIILETEIHDNPIAGVRLQGAGSYRLEESTIHGGVGRTRAGITQCGDAVAALGGVGAWDGGSGLWLAGNQLRDGRGAGLMLHEAGASLGGNSWVDNALALVVQGAGCEDAVAGLEQEPITGELCPVYRYGVCQESFRLFLQVAELEPDSEVGDAPLRALGARPRSLGAPRPTAIPSSRPTPWDMDLHGPSRHICRTPG